jgi:hypothetical protein
MGVLIVPKATTAERTGITPAAGEVIFDETQSVIYFGDGSTLGGLPSMTSVFPVPTQHASGTAALPGVTFSGDTNTGFWRPAADTLAASTNGTERLRITSTGLVGIGTNNPSAGLHISGSTALTARIQLERSGTIGHFSVASGATAFDARGTNLTDGHFRFLVNGSDALRIDSSGNVGIGTTSPAERLAVQTTAGRFEVRPFGDSSVDLGSNGVLRLVAGTTGTRLVVAGVERLNVTATQTQFFNGAGSELMRIDASGNVGIGTSSPARPLHVNNGTSGAITGLSANTAAVFQNDANNVFVQMVSGSSSLSDFVFGTAASPALGRIRYQPSTNNMQFWTNDTERMRITSTGRVGIGTSSPAVGLHVSLTEGDNTFGLFGGTLEFNQVAIGHYSGEGVPDRANPMIYTTSTAGFTGLAGDLVLQGRSSASLARSIVFVTGSTPAERLRITDTGNVGIGTTSPNAAALLDVASTTSGFLPPRMTTAQRDAITSPPNGLLLYDTTTNKLQVRAGGAWVDLH